METLINFCCSDSSSDLMTPKPRLPERAVSHSSWAITSHHVTAYAQSRADYRHIVPFLSTRWGVFLLSKAKHYVCLSLPEPPTKEIESEITESPASNTRRPADKNLGPMLPITKEILRDFYRPFNKKLAKVLHNDSFIWENDSEHQKPQSPFLSSAENHWYVSQWVSSLSSAHGNQ